MLNEIFIGKQISKARKEKGLSQAQFAAQLAISPQAVSKWERGESLPDIILLTEIASIMEKDLNYFVSVSYNENEIDESSSTVDTINQIFKNSYNMSFANWEDADFSHLVNVNGKFSASNIKRCLFKNSNLMETNFKANTIIDCDFTNSIWEGNKIVASTVKKNIFIGSNLSKTIFSSSNIDGCTFEKTNLSDATYKTCNISNNFFIASTLKNTVFKNSSFIKTKITDCEIDNCQFVNCNYKKMEFSNVIFKNTFFKGKIKNITFTNCRADNITYSFLVACKVDVTSIQKIEIE